MFLLAARMDVEDEYLKASGPVQQQVVNLCINCLRPRVEWLQPGASAAMALRQPGRRENPHVWHHSGACPSTCSDECAGLPHAGSPGSDSQGLVNPTHAFVSVFLSEALSISVVV